MFVTLAIASYMLFDPAPWIVKQMQLTYMSNDFRVFIVVLGLVGFGCAYLSERFAFPELAKGIGRTKDRLFPSKKKKRKEYKLVLQSMEL